MTETPANTSPGSTGPDRLERLKEELPTALASGGDALKDCLKRLDAEVRARFKKDVSHQIIARIGTASVTQSNPFPVLMGALNTLGLSVPPETVIRGLLLREKSDTPDELLLDAFVWGLTPSGGEVQGSESDGAPNFIAQLRTLKRHFGANFSALGLQIWDRTREQKNQPEWCEAWASFSRAILRTSQELPKRVQQDLSNRYADCVSQAGAGSAGTLTSFLLFLVGELAPFSAEVASRIRHAPVSLVLKHQTQGLLDAFSSVQAKAVVPTSPAPLVVKETSGEADGRDASEFAGLPQHVELAVKSMLSYLRSLFSAQNTLADDLAAARKDRDALGVQLGEQRDSARKLAEENERFCAELDAARDQRDSERGRAQELERTNAALKGELAEVTASREGLQKEIQAGKEDYERLLGRSDQDIGQLRQHVLDGVYTEIRDFWQIMAKMLEKVARGEREPRHLPSVWNQLDAVLADKLGKPGQPVSVPPPGKSEPQG